MAVKCILTGQTPSVLDGVTENVQTQIDAKAADNEVVHLAGNETISGTKTFTGGVVMKGGADVASSGNAVLNVEGVATDTDYIDMYVSGGTNKTRPLVLQNNSAGTGNVGIGTATPSEKLEVVGNVKATKFKGDGSELTNVPYPVTSVAGKTGAVTLAKGDVGLGNVDNTSDANKPISTATQTALDDKQSKITASGILKGDGTGAVIAAEETEVELVDLPQEVFWAIYDETTYEELNAAYNAGKLIKVKQGNIIYDLTIKFGNSYFYFYNFGNGSRVPVRQLVFDIADLTWKYKAIGNILDHLYFVSLPAASWTGSDPYIQTITVSGLTANTKVDIQPSEELYDQLVADNVGYLAIKNVDGTLTAVAKGGKPSVDLTVQVTYNNVY